MSKCRPQELIIMPGLAGSPVSRTGAQGKGVGALQRLPGLLWSPFADFLVKHKFPPDEFGVYKD